jgi:putative FmdB family regulatory protein
VPTYEYACTECGHRLEVVQRFTDEPLTQCPDCGGELRKVYGAVGIVLKGSGFYKTDSRATAGNGSGGKKESADSASSGSSSSGASEGSGSSDAMKDSGDSGSGGSGKDTKKTAAATTAS